MIQRILPDEPVLAPKFQGLLLRGGVSARLDEELRRRSGAYVVTDAASVAHAIVDVCSAMGGCAEVKLKKDKAEVKRAAVDTARASVASELGFDDPQDFTDMLPVVRGFVKALRSETQQEQLTWPRDEQAAAAKVTETLQSARDLEAACKRVQYNGAMADMLAQRGVTRELFDQRFRDRQSVLCGQPGHRLYTCPQYSQQILDEHKVQVQTETQRQMLHGRDHHRSLEQRLRAEAVNQRTNAGRDRNFRQEFRQSKSRELHAEPQVTVKLTQAQAQAFFAGRSTAAAGPSVSQTSAQRTRAAHSVPARSQGSVSQSSASDDDSLEDQLITWQELGNDPQGSRRRD